MKVKDISDLAEFSIPTVHYRFTKNNASKFNHHGAMAKISNLQSLTLKLKVKDSDDSAEIERKTSFVNRHKFKNGSSKSNHFFPDIIFFYSH